MLDTMLVGTTDAATVFHSGELLSKLRPRLERSGYWMRRWRCIWIRTWRAESRERAWQHAQRAQPQDGIDGQWIDAAGGAAGSAGNFRAPVGGTVLSTPSGLRCQGDSAVRLRHVDPAHPTRGAGVVRGVGIAGVDREGDGCGAGSVRGVAVSAAAQERYPIVYLDAIQVKVRDAGSVTNRAVHLGIGVAEDGRKEVLGLWLGEKEGARYWLTVLNELKARGIQDILIAVVDGLKGFAEVLETTFPEMIVQTCIVHLLRHALSSASYTERAGH